MIQRRREENGKMTSFKKWDPPSDNESAGGGGRNEQIQIYTILRVQAYPPPPLCPTKTKLTKIAVRVLWTQGGGGQKTHTTLFLYFGNTLIRNATCWWNSQNFGQTLETVNASGSKSFPPLQKHIKTPKNRFCIPAVPLGSNSGVQNNLSK